MRINVKEVLEDKSPKFAKWMPNFMINYLKRVVHEDEVNSYLNDFKSLSSIEFVRAILKRMNITYSVEGLEKIDTNRRYIFASNHPLGGLDGLILADIIETKFGDVRLISNDLLMNITPLKDLFIPINKHGKQDVESVKLYNKAFNSNIPINTFPAGLCSRREHGVIEDLEWKHSFIKRAISSQRDIIPVYFDGRLSNFFYNLSAIRKRLHIKANIEMLYLADEMLSQKNSTFKIKIGEPISWQELKNGESPKKWASKIKQQVYQMKQ